MTQETTRDNPHLGPGERFEGEASKHEDVHQQNISETSILGQDHQQREDKGPKDEEGQEVLISEGHRRGTGRIHRDGNRRSRTGGGTSHMASSTSSSGTSRHALDKDTGEDHHQNRAGQSDKEGWTSKSSVEDSGEQSAVQPQPRTRSGLERSEYRSSLEQVRK